MRVRTGSDMREGHSDVLGVSENVLMWVERCSIGIRGGTKKEERNAVDMQLPHLPVRPSVVLLAK